MVRPVSSNREAQTRLPFNRCTRITFVVLIAIGASAYSFARASNYRAFKGSIITTWVGIALYMLLETACSCFSSSRSSGRSASDWDSFSADDWSGSSYFGEPNFYRKAFASAWPSASTQTEKSRVCNPTGSREPSDVAQPAVSTQPKTAKETEGSGMYNPTGSRGASTYIPPIVSARFQGSSQPPRSGLYDVAGRR